MPTADDRAMPGRLKVAVFATVSALIALVIAVTQIPHAQRPSLRQPTVVTTTIITTVSPGG